jgi:hypothetical protein
MAKYFKTTVIPLKTGQNSYVLTEIKEMAGAEVKSVRTRRKGLTLNGHKIASDSVIDATHISFKSAGTEYFEEVPLSLIDLETKNNRNGQGFELNLKPLNFESSKMYVQDPTLIVDNEAIELTFEFEK